MAAAHQQARHVFKPDGTVLNEIDILAMLRTANLLVDGPELFVDVQR